MPAHRRRGRGGGGGGVDDRPLHHHHQHHHHNHQPSATGSLVDSAPAARQSAAVAAPSSSSSRMSSVSTAAFQFTRGNGTYDGGGASSASSTTLLYRSVFNRPGDGGAGGGGGGGGSLRRTVAAAASSSNASSSSSNPRSSVSSVGLEFTPGPPPPIEAAASESRASTDRASEDLRPNANAISPQGRSHRQRNLNNGRAAAPSSTSHRGVEGGRGAGQVADPHSSRLRTFPSPDHQPGPQRRQQRSGSPPPPRDYTASSSASSQPRANTPRFSPGISTEPLTFTLRSSPPVAPARGPPQESSRPQTRASRLASLQRSGLPTASSTTSFSDNVSTEAFSFTRINPRSSSPPRDPPQESSRPQTRASRIASVQRSGLPTASSSTSLSSNASAATVVDGPQSSTSLKQSAAAEPAQPVSQACLICIEPNPQLTTTCCRQPYHLACLHDWHLLKPSCPSCRGPLSAHEPAGGEDEGSSRLSPRERVLRLARSLGVAIHTTDTGDIHIPNVGHNLDDTLLFHVGDAMMHLPFDFPRDSDVERELRDGEMHLDPWAESDEELTDSSVSLDSDDSEDSEDRMRHFFRLMHRVERQAYPDRAQGPHHPNNDDGSQADSDSSEEDDEYPGLIDLTSDDDEDVPPSPPPPAPAAPARRSTRSTTNRNRGAGASGRSSTNRNSGATNRAGNASNGRESYHSLHDDVGAEPSSLYYYGSRIYNTLADLAAINGAGSDDDDGVDDSDEDGLDEGARRYRRFIQDVFADRVPARGPARASSPRGSGSFGSARTGDGGDGRLPHMYVGFDGPADSVGSADQSSDNDDDDDEDDDIIPSTNAAVLEALARSFRSSPPPPPPPLPSSSSSSSTRSDAAVASSSSSTGPCWPRHYSGLWYDFGGGGGGDEDEGRDACDDEVCSCDEGGEDEDEYEHEDEEGEGEYDGEDDDDAGSDGGGLRRGSDWTPWVLDDRAEPSPSSFLWVW